MKKTMLFGFVLCASLTFGQWARCQPEPLTEGMISWEDVRDFDIGPLLPVCKGVDNEYPVAAVDSQDTVWVAWARREGSGDRIYLSSYKDGEWSVERAISETGLIYWPVLLCDSNDLLHLLWSQKADDQWKIQYCTYDGVRPTRPISLTSGLGCDRKPAACLDPDQNVWLAWESDRDGDRNIYVGRIDSGCVEEQVRLSDSNFEDCAPSIAADDSGALWVAWHRYLGGGDFDIFVRGAGPDGWTAETRITRHAGVDAFPSIDCDSKGRLWIAWHSNRRDDGFDITNWIYLRCLDGGQLFDPAAPMPARILEKHGTDQGFEFPTVHVDRSDRVWIFGRPSHNFCAQYYHGGAWSPLIRLPKDGWGGRGQYVRVAEDSQGSLWLARRSLQENTLQKISDLPEKRRKLKLEPVHLPAASEAQSPERADASGLEVEGTPYKVFFGDIHAHTWMSDGVNSIEEFWAGARDIREWDFASLTDHDDFVGNRISPSEWAEMKYLANRYDDPGRFVTLNAYEWTTARPPTGFGHKNVYYTEEDPPLFAKSDPNSQTARDLFAQIRPRKGLAFPHHIAWTGADWENFDPDIETCFEIVSNHGVFEYMGNQPIKHRGGRPREFVQDGLAKGLRFGIIGGSDCHGLLWHHRVSYKRDCWRAGATAVLAKELTRDSVMHALRNRRCYAVTGVKIFIDFRADGHLMGQEYQTPTPPEISILVKGVSPLHYVTLVRDNRDIYVNGGDSDQCKFTYTDELLQPGQHYYYVRVLQRDGEMAWSSPIWVDYQP